MSSNILSILESSQLVKQGAEAKVYKGYLQPLEDSNADISYTSKPVLFKYRFKKNYRHPTLNASLTKSRVNGEARALKKCQISGVCVPRVHMVNASEGVIALEWIEGNSVRVLLGEEDEESEPLEANEEQNAESLSEPLSSYNISQSELMTLIGIEIAKMHKANVIHGDLTTSNMMLRKSSKNNGAELVLIDFGLSFNSASVEDKAVDLYVLERAFSSTHPDSESLFEMVLTSYSEEMGTAWEPLKKKLDEVRLRGRKRSMVG
ncbi:bud32 kinase [Pyrrhoderma noxium]|uniref:non-specific serine/threonine protein kinase n=1 Tax=Pyrrhoderma noxium TaxID=2282107 RepID=A0A286U5Z4_9AGAM|nr:bud32 kinase [Pyrrhoderma noxium]